MSAIEFFLGGNEVDKGNGRKTAQRSGMPFQDPHGHGEAQGKLLSQNVDLEERRVRGEVHARGVGVAILPKTPALKVIAPVPEPPLVVIA